MGEPLPLLSVSICVREREFIVAIEDCILKMSWASTTRSFSQLFPSIYCGSLFFIYCHFSCSLG